MQKKGRWASSVPLIWQIRLKSPRQSFIGAHFGNISHYFNTTECCLIVNHLLHFEFKGPNGFLAKESLVARCYQLHRIMFCKQHLFSQMNINFNTPSCLPSVVLSQLSFSEPAVNFSDTFDVVFIRGPPALTLYIICSNFLYLF